MPSFRARHVATVSDSVIATKEPFYRFLQNQALTLVLSRCTGVKAHKGKPLIVKTRVNFVSILGYQDLDRLKANFTKCCPIKGPKIASK